MSSYKSNHKYSLPPEWACQDGILLTWPDDATDWQPYLAGITETYLQLAGIITSHERLVVAARHAEEVRAMLAGHLSAQQMLMVSIFPCDINDTWARDHGPITLTDGAGEPLLLDFRFNGWGEKFAWEKDNAITRNLYAQQAFNGAIMSHDDFVLEGGSIETDGHGTVFTTTHCLMAANRNQPLTQGEIEQRLKCSLNARRIVWLNYGTLIGDDTDGHIDTIVRVCPDNTLVYIGCDDEDDAQYVDFKALERQLKEITTPAGDRYRLLRLPFPDAIYDDGYRLPATYANFVIINGAVIVPTYGQREKDAQAMTTIGMAFPNREIVGVDATVVVRQHGSLHCLTMQLPKGTLRLH